MTETASIPTPPRLTGDPASDVQILQDYLWRFYRALNLETDVNGSLLTVGDRLAALEEFQAGVEAGTHAAAEGLLQQRYLSDATALAANTATTFTHELGVEPDLVQIELICGATSEGYAAGDVLVVNPAINSQGGAGCGFSVTKTSTSIVVRTGSNAVVAQIINGSTGVGANLTIANWTYRVRAFAVSAPEEE